METSPLASELKLGVFFRIIKLWLRIKVNSGKTMRQLKGIFC